MGMAASQARFLGLTARKNNVEFEGQQINQQRTALGNQSANYYNDLLGMSVPVPPSVQDFTKTVYSFQDGNLNNNITALIAQNNGEYKVSYVSSWQNDFTPVSNGAAVIFKDTTGGGTAYKVGNQILRVLGKPSDMQVYDEGTSTATNLTFVSITSGVQKYNDGTDDYFVKDGKMYTDAACTSPATGKSLKYNGNNAYFKTLTGEQVAKAIDQEAEYVKILQNKYGSTTNWYVRYVENTTSGVYEPIFYDKNIVENAQYDENQTGASQSNIPCYKIGAAQETEEVKGVDARLEKDATGRYINITLMPSTGVELTYALTTSTITDQDAYNDAMNQYEFDKAKYDQAIQEINAKIEIVQAEDKSLELRLKQLDTEQDAISTEMDAVQKVIEKNTESTFKTFG